jgi:hypothetical protein
MPVATVEKPVVKEDGNLTTDYRLVGRIAQWGEVDTRGQHVTFSFVNDPQQTKMPLIIAGFQNDFYHQNVYKVFVYTPDFGGTYELYQVIGSDLKQRIFDGSPLVQLQMKFLTSRLGSQEQALMNSLESANRGEWQNLPKDPIVVESIGIVKTP